MIIILNGGGLNHLFSEYDDNIVTSNNKLPHKFERPSLVVFAGGTDVNPLFYGENRLPITGYPDKKRDENEALWFSHCRINKIPMVGICRGSQFGCIMSGGSLYQHVTNHGIHGLHDVITDDGRVFGVTSTHHQMMRPEFTNHELIAWTPERRSKVYLYDHKGEDVPQLPEKEPEVVYFKDTDFLAVQYHPEYMESYEEGRVFFGELLEKYIPNL